VEVDVARAFDGDAVEPGRQFQSLDQASGDRPRRLAKLACEVKRAGTGQVPQPPLGRHFHGRVVVDSEGAGKGASQRVGDQGFPALQHRSSRSVPEEGPASGSMFNDPGSAVNEIRHSPVRPVLLPAQPCTGLVP